MLGLTLVRRERFEVCDFWHLGIGGIKWEKNMDASLFVCGRILWWTMYIYLLKSVKFRLSGVDLTSDYADMLQL